MTKIQAVALAGAFLIQAAAAHAEAPRASLMADDLQQFLAGRVLIEMQTEEQTYTSIPKGRVFGYVWRDDGTATVCMAGLHKGRRIGPLELDWYLRESDDRLTTWSMRVQGRKPPKRLFVPVFGESTEEIELWLEHDGRWIVAKRAWVQDTWPAILAAACPGMPLEGLAINRRQTDPEWERMRAQDPSAPLAAPSGASRCVGDHEGIATWTLGADGKRVWDTSRCRPRTE